MGIELDKQIFVLALKKICYVFLFSVLCGVNFLHAQSKSALEYQVKAAFLYNFTRFISWPAEAFSEPDSPFLIGIAGNDPFGSYIDELVEGENVDGHPIVVQRYKDVNDVGNCHVLFINIDAHLKVKEIFTRINKNTLTVSDVNGFINWGGEIHFYKEDNKIKIQVNMEAVKKSQLEISSKLLKIAKIL